MTTQQATIIQNLTDEVEKQGAHARPEAASSLLTFAQAVAVIQTLGAVPAEVAPVAPSEPAPEPLPESSSSSSDESGS